jgi:hypothetical protein
MLACRLLDVSPKLGKYVTVTDALRLGPAKRTPARGLKLGFCGMVKSKKSQSIQPVAALRAAAPGRWARRLL